MNTRADQFGDDELPDDEAVEMTEESKRLAAEAEERNQPPLPDDDDDDDFDLIDDEDEDDEDEDLGKATPDEDDEDYEEDEDADEDDAGGDGHRNAARQKREEKAKPLSKSQQRIKELATKRRAAEKEAFEAELRLDQRDKELEALQARLAKLEAGGKSIETGKPEPDPKNYEYGEVDQKYIDDLVAHKLADERAKFMKDREKEIGEDEQKRLLAHYTRLSDKVRAAGEKKFGGKYALVDETPFTPEIARAVLDSDSPVDISYYFARNLSKLREFTRMTDAQKAKALGRLEERFSVEASTGKKRTKAPDTPGKKRQRPKPASSKYGPDDQDEFDKLFWGR